MAFVIPFDDILVCFVVCMDRCGWAFVRVLLLDFDEIYDWEKENTCRYIMANYMFIGLTFRLWFIQLLR